MLNFFYKKIPSWREIIMQEVICKCWNKFFTQRQHLKSWASKNCWCNKKERFAEVWRKHKKHWMEWTIPYRKYFSLKARCENINNDSYKSYWWRWIKCEWKTFEEFWIDMKDVYNEHLEKYWIKNTTIDRIDVNWNYCKENCRWATLEVQANNKRNNRYIEYKWEILTISQAARKYWLDQWLLKDRITKQLWTVSNAIEIWKLSKNTKRLNYKAV